MPEQEMYTLVCKDRFDKIDAKLEQIEQKLNNNNGLLTRTAILEERDRALESRWKWLIGASTTLTIAVIVKLLYEVFAR